MFLPSHDKREQNQISTAQYTLYNKVHLYFPFNVYNMQIPKQCKGQIYCENGTFVHYYMSIRPFSALQRWTNEHCAYLGIIENK